MAERVGAEERIGAYFTDVIDILEPWARTVAHLFDDGAAPSPATVDAAVAELVTPALRRDEPPLVGAGYIAAADVLAGTTWHMAWWQGEGPQRLATVSPAEAGEIYARREWFTVPMATGMPHVTGPYVDFLCTDEYTVTLTVPVPGAPSVGVVGADLFAAALEEPLGRDLAAIGPEASLVNRSGRVLVSADPEVAAGAVLVRPWEASAWTAELRDGGKSVALRPLSSLPLAILGA